MESTSTPRLPALCVTFEEFPSIQVGVLEAGPANIGEPMIMIPAIAIRQMEIHSTIGITRQYLRDAAGHSPAPLCRDR